ncbi:MAG TPA: hypothetical protein VMM76_23460 [Pirellulaceae bacterium]|nr:hypothetical protein [Pirellulaceae bacterium]
MAIRSSFIAPAAAFSELSGCKINFLEISIERFIYDFFRSCKLRNCKSEISSSSRNATLAGAKTIKIAPKPFPGSGIRSMLVDDVSSAANFAKGMKRKTIRQRRVFDCPMRKITSACYVKDQRVNGFCRRTIRFAINVTLKQFVSLVNLGLIPDHPDTMGILPKVAVRGRRTGVGSDADAETGAGQPVPFFHSLGVAS